MGNEETEEFKSYWREEEKEIVLNWYGIGDSIILSFWILNLRDLEGEFEAKRNEGSLIEKESSKGNKNNIFLNRKKMI